MNKKIIIEIIIALLIIVTGVFIIYNLINNVTNKEERSADINSILVDVEKNFEIIFLNKKPTDSYKLYTILDKDETDKYDYTIYGYNGIVKIKIDGEEYLLKDALLQNKITMEEIIEKANKDLPYSSYNTYMDGGSKEYHYENYTIIKLNKLEYKSQSINQDVYIGTKEMKLNDVID